MLSCLDRDISDCVRQLDRAQHPIAFRAWSVYGIGPGRDYLESSRRSRTVNQDPAHAAVLFKHPKASKGSYRLLAQLSLLDHIEYQEIAWELGHESEALVNATKYSFRPSRDDSPDLWEQSPDGKRDPFWRRRRFENDVVLMRDVPSCYKTDVKEFYPSIRHRVLLDSIRAKNAGAYRGRERRLECLLQRLGQLLEGFYPQVGCGLPQGPEASFLLSEIPLLAIHERCHRADHWMMSWSDDTLHFAFEDGRLVSQTDQYHCLLAEIGLSVNADKTGLIATKNLWVVRVWRKEAALRSVMDGCGSYDAISLVLSALREELDTETPCTHWIRRLLRMLAQCLQPLQYVPQVVLNEIVELFKRHNAYAGDSLQTWLWLLNSGINYDVVQQALGELILSQSDLLDTELAFLSESFQLARCIQDPELGRCLGNRWEEDASYRPAIWSGDAATRNGKALRALQKHYPKHGDGLLWDVYASENYYRPMRQYSIVAAGDLSATQRREFCRLLRKGCTPEELLAINHFEHNGEVTPPVRRTTSIDWNY